MHDQRISRDEQPCNHHPSPAEEEGQVESAVLAFVLDLSGGHHLPLVAPDLRGAARRAW